MNLPNFKTVLQKLSFLRHNFALLVPIIIVLVAIVLFLPNRLLRSELRKQIDAKSISQIKRLQGIDNVSPEQVELERRRLKAYANDINEIENLLRQTTQRELLSYMIFPQPHDRSPVIFDNFGKRFRGSVEDLLSRAKTTARPTTIEIDRAMQRLSSRTNNPAFGYGMGRGPMASGGMLNRIESADQQGFSDYRAGPTLGLAPTMGLLGLGFTDTVSAIAFDEICKDKARSGAFYADPADLSGYGFWQTYSYIGEDAAIKDCWYSQLGYWIIEDVFNTITAMDAGSTSVFDSPVKRLGTVSFSMGMRTRSPSRSALGLGRAAMPQYNEDKPIYIRSFEDSIVEPCTARYCNNEIDVIHFRFSVVLRTDAILKFMAELCSAKEHKFRGYPDQNQPEQTFKHNQITILESTARSFDRQGAGHELYRYGDDPVVELELICEYIFDKQGYDKIKPELIKKELQASGAAAG